MRIVVAWLGVQVGRQWRALLVLGLLVALSVGTVLVSVAGARRGASAVDRLLEVTQPATVVVNPQESGFDWSPIQALPDVEAMSTFVLHAGFGVDEVPGETADQYVPADAEAMRTVERPVVLAGRLADPARADEAVVTSAFVATGYGVGDELTLRLFSVEEVDNGVSATKVAVPPRPSGPTVRVRIVGVVRSLYFRDTAGDPGRLFPSVALFEQYRANMLGTSGNGALSALVRLRDGAAGIDALRAELSKYNTDADTPQVDVLDRRGDTQRIRDVAMFQSGFLLVFALAAFVAAVAMVGQAIARYTASSIADLYVLSVLGMTSRERVACAAAAPVLVGAAGAVLGATVAALASALLPFGVAADIEPDPGIDLDLLVLGAGLLVTIALVACAAAATATLALVRSRRPASSRPSMVAARAAAWGLPVPVVVGARFALEPGSGPRTVTVRAAVLGAITGILGVTAAVTFGSGVADATAHPERFGQTFQISIGYGCCGYDTVPAGPVQAVVAGVPGVARVDNMRFAVADAGQVTVLVLSTPPTSDPPAAIIEGRTPAAPGEVLLAYTTARQLNAGIGSTVEFARVQESAELRVVGIGLLPQTPSNDYDIGAWVVPDTFDQLFGSFFLNHWGLITLQPDADPTQVTSNVEAAVRESGISSAPLFPDFAGVPTRLAEIGQLRGLTLVLAGFLGLIALGAVGYTLVTSVRRRRGEIAVLLVLGMTRRQARLAIVTQASLLGGIGLLVGVPVGVALGRVLWQVVSDSTPLQYQTPVSFVALLLVVPVVLLLANALAAWPGRHAARLPIAEVLRAE